MVRLELFQGNLNQPLQIDNTSPDFYQIYILVGVIVVVVVVAVVVVVVVVVVAVVVVVVVVIVVVVCLRTGLTMKRLRLSDFLQLLIL
jgi:Flp pilus assembly protein TadB